DVLGGVVVVDVQVALGVHGDVEAGKARQQGEHVGEKADAGGDLRRAGAGEVGRDLDVGFLCGALDRGFAPGVSAVVNGERLVSGDRRVRHSSVDSSAPRLAGEVGERSEPGEGKWARVVLAASPSPPPFAMAPRST